ncbi:MAG: SCO family protein [Alphaproteobacteria bacterium]
MHRFVILGVAGLAIGLGIVLGLYKFQQPAAVIYKDSTDITTSIRGDFTLTDQFGKPRSTTEFRGKILLVYFGYTYCPDVCPMALEHITKALQMLGSDRDKITVLFVSVDPSRDTVETLKLYSTNFDPNIIMLTGPETAVQNAMNKYRVYAKKENKPEFSDYLINHTSVVYVMGTDGTYLSSFAHSTSPEAIQSILLKILQAQVSVSFH